MSDDCGADAVVPISDGQVQPLIAIYHKRIMPVLYDQLSEKRLRISDLLGRISVCYVQAENIGANPQSLSTLIHVMILAVWKKNRTPSSGTDGAIT